MEILKFNQNKQINNEIFIFNKAPYFGKNVDWVETLKFCNNEN